MWCIYLSCTADMTSPRTWSKMYENMHCWFWHLFHKYKKLLHTYTKLTTQTSDFQRLVLTSRVEQDGQSFILSSRPLVETMKLMSIMFHVKTLANFLHKLLFTKWHYLFLNNTSTSTDQLFGQPSDANGKWHMAYNIFTVNLKDPLRLLRPRYAG